ncbi:MAG: hypothetical protein U0230_01435 [Polyangiales bacterium]
MRSLVSVLALSILASACDDSPTDRPGDYYAATVPAATVPETGVRREIFEVPGYVPSANPDATTNAATPSRLNATQVVRYRVDARTPVPVSAIVLAMPGFLAGAGTFDQLARILVRKSAAEGTPIEVWAIDRRSNLLEDLRGMDTAEARGEPEIAYAYYHQLAKVGGQEFPGYLEQRDLLFESEWGLVTHVEDVRRVVALVPEAERRGHVFLLGHSLGGFFAEAYAAHRFESDGKRGFDELAGLILVDGILADAPTDEASYLGGSVAGGFPMPGLTAIRSTNPFSELPLLGVAAQTNAEITALRALFDPDGIAVDPERDMQLAILSGGIDIPKLTNEAALGWAFDSQYQPLAFARASIGHLAGGPVETYANAFGGGSLERPSDPSATYTWVDGPDAAPPEVSSVADLAVSITSGRTNLAEWYFPTRLSLDLAAVGGGAISESGWQAGYGLRTFDGPSDDAPVLCVVAALVGDVARCDSVRTRIAPQVGTGRPLAGQGRGAPGASVPGFRTLDVSAMAHIDPASAREGAGNPVPNAVLSFVAENVAAGTLVVPAR